MKEKEEVSNSDVLKDITPQNEIQMWQCLKLCVLLSLARQGYGRAAAVPACRLLPSEEDATATALLVFLPGTKQSKRTSSLKGEDL